MFVSKLPITEMNLDWFLRNAENKINRYPLTDLSVDGANNLHIELAVAGFTKDDIEIELKDNQLIIAGTHPREKYDDVTYIQQHISQNDFRRVVLLHDCYIKGDITAETSNGILHITVSPAENERKMIKIK